MVCHLFNVGTVVANGDFHDRLKHATCSIRRDVTIRIRGRSYVLNGIGEQSTHGRSLVCSVGDHDARRRRNDIDHADAGCAGLTEELFTYGHSSARQQSVNEARLSAVRRDAQHSVADHYAECVQPRVHGTQQCRCTGRVAMHADGREVDGERCAIDGFNHTISHRSNDT